MVQGVSNTTVHATTPSSKAEGVDERKPVAPGAAPTENQTATQGANDNRVPPVDRVEKPENRPQQGPQLRLGIAFHEDTGRFIYRGINPSPREIERQYPPEEMLRRLSLFREVTGSLVDTRL